MSDLASEVTKNLKEILIEKAICGTDLADGAKLPKSTVYRSLENEQVPSLPTLVAMAKFLGVTIDRIVFGKEAENVGAIKKDRAKTADRRQRNNRSR